MLSTLAVVCSTVTNTHLAAEACLSKYKRRVVDKGHQHATYLRQSLVSPSTKHLFQLYLCVFFQEYVALLNSGRTMVGACHFAGRILVFLDGRSHFMYYPL